MWRLPGDKALCGEHCFHNEVLESLKFKMKTTIRSILPIQQRGMARKDNLLDKKREEITAPGGFLRPHQRPLLNLII